MVTKQSALLTGVDRWFRVNLRFKKMKYCSLLFGLLLLVSCGSDDSVPVMESLEIELVSGAGSGITGETRGEGATNSFLAANLPISLLHQERPKGSSTYPAYTTANCIYAELKHTDLIGDQYRILNNPKLYYRKDGGDTRFVGWHPHAEGLGVLGEKPTDNLSRWDASSGTVYCDIDGSTPILWAERIEGTHTNRFGTDNYLEFRHVLTKAVISVSLEKNTYKDYWSDIATVEFINKKQECQLVLPASNNTDSNATVTTIFSPSSTHLTMKGKDTQKNHLPFTLTDTDTEVGYVLLAPDTDVNAELEIRITTVKGDAHTVFIPYKGEQYELRAGKKCDIHLVFSVKEVLFNGCTINEWGSTVPGENGNTITIGND